jgi:hypothetical protein
MYENGKNKLFGLLSAALLPIAVTPACGGDGGSEYKSFDSSLPGAWETNTPPDYLDGYKDSVVITRDTITITGYEVFIGYGASETTRPFRGVTHGGALPGYSEKTVIHDYPDHDYSPHIGKQIFGKICDFSLAIPRICSSGGSP